MQELFQQGGGSGTKTPTNGQSDKKSKTGTTSRNSSRSSSQSGNEKDVNRKGESVAEKISHSGVNFDAFDENALAHLPPEIRDKLKAQKMEKQKAQKMMTKATDAVSALDQLKKESSAKSSSSQRNWAALSRGVNGKNATKRMQR